MLALLEARAMLSLGSILGALTGPFFFKPCRKRTKGGAGSEDLSQSPIDRASRSGSAVELEDSRSFDVEATNYTDFSRKDLGRNHSSMNVRNCGSTICVCCQDDEKQGVYFVKSK